MKYLALLALILVAACANLENSKETTSKEEDRPHRVNRLGPNKW